MTGIIKATVSCMAIMTFVLGCVAWGRTGASMFPYGAGAVWLALAIGVARLWYGKLQHVLFTAGGAVVAATIWSVILVDFPPLIIERLLGHVPIVVSSLIVLSPALLAAAAGATMCQGYLLSGGLMLLLAGVAVFPVSIWNVQTHMSEVCEGVIYVYPYVTPAYGLMALAMMTVLGVGGAALGRFLGARLSAMTARAT